MMWGYHRFVFVIVLTLWLLLTIVLGHGIHHAFLLIAAICVAVEFLEILR